MSQMTAMKGMMMMGIGAYSGVDALVVIWGTGSGSVTSTKSMSSSESDDVRWANCSNEFCPPITEPLASMSDPILIFLLKSASLTYVSRSDRHQRQVPTKRT